MKLNFIETKQAPGAAGPYSQGVKGENLMFTSGQLPVDAITGVLSKGDIQKETKLCLDNVKAVVEAGGGTIEDIIKVTIFITDMNNFSSVNKVYAEFFGDHKPARSCIEISKLPNDADVEIEAVAII